MKEINWIQTVYPPHFTLLWLRSSTNSETNKDLPQTSLFPLSCSQRKLNYFKAKERKKSHKPAPTTMRQAEISGVKWQMDVKYVYCCSTGSCLLKFNRILSLTEASESWFIYLLRTKLYRYCSSIFEIGSLYLQFIISQKICKRNEWCWITLERPKTSVI